MSSYFQEERDMLFGKTFDEDGNIVIPYFSEYVDDEYEDEGTKVYDRSLLEQRIEYIRNLKPEMIDKVEVIGQYEDDHEQCLDVYMYINDGNVIPFAAMWIVSEFVAEIYAASKYNILEAKKEIVDYLQSFLPEKEGE